jgi:branched-chain amino acid transport system ATP-binding protein
MLQVSGIEASYGDSQVLFGVDFSVAAGEVVALLGRNGMGKTTTVRAVMGILPPRRGEILLDGVAVHGMPSYRVARLGLGLVPEGRQIFPNLSVRENLIATAANRGAAAEPWTLDTVLALFPSLR